jgi:AcrR family transcriptional regulator
MNQSDDGPKPRGRPRGFDRDQALEAAMRLFWSRGYEATSISDLTQAMGVTPPSLYGAFGDKKRLFLEAVERYQARAGWAAQEALLNEPTAERAIRRLMLETVDYFTDPKSPKGCLVVLGATNCGPEAADMAETLADRRRAASAAIRARIASGQVGGELAPGADAAALADLVTATLYGLAIKARDGVPRKALKASVEQFLRLWPRARADVAS